MICFHFYTKLETEPVGFLYVWKKICCRCKKVLEEDGYCPRWK